MILTSGTSAASWTLACGTTTSRKTSAVHNITSVAGIATPQLSGLLNMSLVAVSAAHLPNGKILTWASDGAGAFTIAPATRETPGTEVLLHIKADACGGDVTIRSYLYLRISTALAHTQYAIFGDPIKI